MKLGHSLQLVSPLESGGLSLLPLSHSTPSLPGKGGCQARVTLPTPQMGTLTSSRCVT